MSDFQCHPKPKRLTWAEAACFMVTGPTAYRQLFGWPGNVVKPGEVVLIWGGAGGLGSMAIQLTRIAGAIPIAVASTDERAKFCLELGAEGVVDRTKFDHWGRLPDTTDEAGMNHFHKGARAFGKAIWEILGTRQLPKVVLEHSGQDTLPTSMYVCDNGGMVVICGGSTGYNGDVDLRHLWMRSKRLQGSHASNFREYREVIKLIDAGLLQPCLSACGTIEDVGLYHQLLHENLHPSGNMAVHINATESGSTELA
ncbi:zinc-binding dehydrogenase [Antrihabitans sp. YC3-6]|uniref:Zinc-binding dehydrogenase n=1 Tax=Antrihabitans stalagmiti TaxID=2799499 RepID=A0A934NN91_9NOCA|nr:zinc-binding dehydrogenase [Antrihabitans stalagmiti]MBJ8338368.1 zinc-binding dehydrogenase [Antrihabitans stalagmiti]